MDEEGERFAGHVGQALAQELPLTSEEVGAVLRELEGLVVLHGPTGVVSTVKAIEPPTEALTCFTVRMADGNAFVGDPSLFLPLSDAEAELYRKGMEAMRVVMLGLINAGASLRIDRGPGIAVLRSVLQCQLRELGGGDG